MKRVIIAAVVCVLSVAGFASAAHADLDGFLAGVNAQARVDVPGFHAKLSAQFGVPLPTVQTIYAQIGVPGDVFMILQLGEFAHQPPEVVLKHYRGGKKKGWGVLAKELGIKPGSAEFHALKAGNLVFTGEPGANSKGKGKGQAKGKGKGKNKD